MSTLIMSQCWPLEMPPTAKAVLISLADNANDHGYCWPSLGSISKRTCFSERAVQNAIKWLESAGVLVADRSNGRHTTYVIYPGRFQPEIDSKPPQQMHPRSRCTPAGDSKTPAAGAGDPRSRCVQPPQEVPSNRQEPSLNRQEPNDVCDLANSATQTDRSLSSGLENGIRDPVQTRAVEIAVLLRHRGAAVQAGQPYLLDWASQGISDAQLLAALETAQAQRHERGDPTPINAGLLNAIVQSQRRSQQGKQSGGRFKTRSQSREQTAQLMYSNSRQHGGFDGQTIDHE